MHQRAALTRDTAGVKAKKYTRLNFDLMLKTPVPA